MLRRPLSDKMLALLLLGLAGSATACLTAQPPWYGALEAIGIRFITAPEVKGMMDRGERFVLIDARDEIHYRNGHLPGAIALPAEDAPLKAVDARRPKRLLYPERLPADRTRPLVFYCGGLTWAQSLDAAVAAYHLGFRNIMVMHGGDKEWAARGYPFESIGTEDEHRND